MGHKARAVTNHLGHTVSGSSIGQILSGRGSTITGSLTACRRTIEMYDVPYKAAMLTSLSNENRFSLLYRYLMFDLKLAPDKEIFYRSCGNLREVKYTHEGITQVYQEKKGVIGCKKQYEEL